MRWLLPLLAFSLAGCGATQSITDGTKSAFNAVFYKKIKVLHLDFTAREALTAHELMGTLSAVLLKYEPRLKKITVVLLEQNVPGELRYAIDAELKGIGLVRYGTEFMPEGRVMLRHLKQQQYIDTATYL
nr:hypothetical protein [Pantoea sp. B550]